jgi:hypothetical protein
LSKKFLRYFHHQSIFQQFFKHKMGKKKIIIKKKKKKTLNVPLGGSTKHKFKTFTYRNIELDDLVKISDEDFAKIITTKPRRRMLRGLNENCSKLIKKIRRSVRLIN